MYIRVLLTIFLLFSFCISGFSQNKKDKPRLGEGIYAFLIRNKCSASSDYKEFLNLNKGKFGKNNSLIMGRYYILPSNTKNNTATQTQNDKDKDKDNTTPAVEANTKGKKRKNALYGKKYADYTIKSNSLKGATFFLSSGHGGPDPGAIGKINGREIHEDEYAYDITLRLARILEEQGATVYMIIQDAKDGIRDDIYLANSKTETCMGKAIPLNQKARLKQRTDKINQLSAKSKSKYKRAVFIHLDSRSQKQQLDVFFYHFKNSSAGKALAFTMRNTFRSQYRKHQPNRGFTGTVGPRDLYVVQNSSPVAVFAELGNIQNTFDQRRFLDPNNRQALAYWLSLGLLNDYNNWKKK